MFTTKAHRELQILYCVWLQAIWQNSNQGQPKEWFNERSKMHVVGIILHLYEKDKSQIKLSTDGIQWLSS